MTEAPERSSIPRRGRSGRHRLGAGWLPPVVCLAVAFLAEGAAAAGDIASDVDAGGAHTCGVTQEGVVKCWGQNGLGQLGDGTMTERRTPVTVQGLTSGVAAVSAGGSHTCAITEAGAVQCWGRNAFGQLGDGARFGARPLPVDVQGLAHGTVAVSAGAAHTCAITDDGGARCWGRNFSGQLGDGTTTDRSTPMRVTGLSAGVVAISSGAFHTCAVTQTGGVSCWGGNQNGELGEGTTEDRRTPTEVRGLSSGVVAISATYAHTCALMAHGGVKCWGYNASGQLGDGTTTNRLEATDVEDVEDAVAIACGREHSCAVTRDGKVKCWGRNVFGQLGDATNTARHRATDVRGLVGRATDLSAGLYHTCATTEAGAVWCWGRNYDGQLGDGTPRRRLTPVDVRGLAGSVTSVSAGGSETCAVTEPGDVRCWGGHGDPRRTPVDVDGIDGAAYEISVGSSHACALVGPGGAKCWGRNYDGELGDGTTTSRPKAEDVAGITGDLMSISAGDYHNCAVTSGGVAKCWGRNNGGQLGVGDTSNRPTPEDVHGLSSPVVAISAGWRHSCALTSEGGVSCWGSNVDGEVGDGTTTPRFDAVEVSTLATGVASISTGVRHTCALSDAGGVKCWGRNTAGEVGDGTISRHRSTPVDVASLAAGVKAISAGGRHTCALMDVGAVKCWGSNYNGELGDGTRTDRATPMTVEGLVGRTEAISAGSDHTCAVSDGGTIQCWGYNGQGQLANGEAGNYAVPRKVLGFSALCSVSPATTCVGGFGKGFLRIRETVPGQERLMAKLAKGPALAASAFGDPVQPGGTAYGLCVYDDIGTLVGQMNVDRAGEVCAARSCWRAIPDGYAYEDETTAADGILLIKLTAGEVGASRLVVKGANKSGKSLLHLPGGIAARLQRSASATLQLMSSDARCFEITLKNVRYQRPDLFKAVQ